MEEDFDNLQYTFPDQGQGKIKGFRFSIDHQGSVAAFPGPVARFALGYVFVKQQVHEYYKSSSSFSLIPPPAILNLRSVDRDQHVEGLIAKHTEGLNSQQLKTNVIMRLKNTPEYKSILWPFSQGRHNCRFGFHGFLQDRSSRQQKHAPVSLSLRTRGSERVP